MSHNEITEQVKRWVSPIGRILAMGEIRKLPSLIKENETIQYIAHGRMKSGHVLIVVTDLRLMIIDKKPFDLRVDEYSYNRISRVEYDTSVFFGSLMISIPGFDVEMYRLNQRSAPAICGAITENIKQSLDNTHEHQQIPSEENGVVSKLERLALLYEKGILNETELEQQKQALLESANQSKDSSVKFNQPSEDVMNFHLPSN